MSELLDLSDGGPSNRTSIADPAIDGDLAWLMSLVARPTGGSGASRVRGGKAPDHEPTYVVLPSTSAPRLLFSEGLPTSAVRGHADPTNTRAILRRRAMQAAASQVGRRVLGTRVHVTGRPARLDEHLAEVIGVDGAGILVRPGEPGRANRKPIVQVVDRRTGATLAWVKVGWNDLTTRLVRAEGLALNGFDDPHGQMITPTIVDAGRWHGLDLLVTDPLPEPGPAVPLTEIRHAALLLEVARRGLGTTRMTLRDGPWRTSWTSRVAEIASPRRGQLLSLLVGLLDERGQDQLLIGSWHGDWTPWNMHVGANEVQVWDWERSCGGVPVGLDAFHHTFQQELLTDGKPVTEAIAATRAATLPILAMFETGGDDLVEIVYFMELAARWGADVAEPSGAWLAPHLDALIAHLHREIAP